MNGKFGYDFEFLEIAHYEEMRLVFQSKKIIVGNKSPSSHLEERFNAIYFKTQHNLKIFILRIFNILLPLLILPFMEVYMEIIKTIIIGELDSYFWFYGILSFLGIVMLLIQIYLNTLLFNYFSFDFSRNMNRNVRFSDLLLPGGQVIAPIIAYALYNIQYFYFINTSIQILIVGFLLLTYCSGSTFFNPNVNEIYGACLIFRLLTLIVFALCTVLTDYPVFLIIFLSLAARLSLNLTRLIRDKISNNLNLKSLSMKEREEDEDQKQNRQNFAFYNSKLISFFSNFYYLKESVKPPFFQILEEIPLCYIGNIREHLNICTKSTCPILKNKDNLESIISSSFLKKLSLEFDWGDKINIRSNLAKFIAEIYRVEGNILTNAKNETRFLYILYLLFHSRGIIQSILTLNSLYLRNLAYHERFVMFSMREFLSKYLKMIEESTLLKFRESDSMVKQNKKRLKKEETRFESSIFVELEKNFNLLKKNIDDYMTKLKHFLKELTLEKVSISNLESLGKCLLDKHEEIKSAFMRAKNNIRFVKVYREFITIFREDEWELRRDLTKHLRLINQVEENYEQADSNHGNGGGFSLTDETHFFNEKSCFLYVSGLEKTIGKILKSDENTANLFGYANASSMVGVSIEDLMPKLFGSKHSAIMLSYLNTGRTNFIYRENKLFGMDKRGFTFPLHLTIKPYMSRNNYSLEFLAHMKPSLNKKETIIICDDLGNIDCFGESLEPIFNQFYEKNRKQCLPIQALIPDLLEYFQTTANNFIIANKDALEENKTKRSVKSRYGTTRSYKTFRSVLHQPRKKTQILVQRKKPIEMFGLFNNYLKNEFGDMIFQIILKDNYPSFPSPLNMDSLEENLIINYMNSVKNLILTNESPCDVFRIDISIESRFFSDLSINILRIRRFKHLYRNTKNDSIEKILTKMKKNTITLLPKILKQTGVLKIKKKVKNGKHRRNGMKSDENIEIPKTFEKDEINNNMSPKQKKKKRRNSDITHCPHLYIEEANTENETLKPELERDLIIRELRKNKDFIEKQISLHDPPNLPDKESIIQHLKDPSQQTFIKVKKETIFSKKIKTACEGKDLLSPNYLNPTPKPENKKPEKTDKKLLNMFSRSMSSLSMINREEQKFYADEGRHLYKIQSKDNSFAIFTQTIEEENENAFDVPSKASSLVSNTRDTKKEYRKLMEQKYLPPSYKNILIFVFVAIILAVASFFSYGGLSNQMLSSLGNGLYTTELVENYKINILKLLVIQQNKLAFQTDTNLQQFNETYYELKNLDFNLKNPPLKQFSDNDLTVEIVSANYDYLSIIMAMSLYFEAIEDSISEEFIDHQFIIDNGLGIFTAMENLFSFQNEMDQTLSSMKTNLIVLVLISLSLMSFLMFSIFTNLYFSDKFINSTLKLLCSITIKDYKAFYSNIFESNFNNYESENLDKQTKIKKKLSIKNQVLEQKNANMSQVKKKVRHQVVPLKFSKINLLLLFIFLALYTTLFILDLNQSQLLDSTLLNRLLRENFFNSLRIKFYHLYSLMNDLELGYNRSSNALGLIQTRIDEIGTDLDNILSLDNILTGTEKDDFDNAIKNNLCLSDMLNQYHDLVYQCPMIGNGVLVKGLYSGFMYLYSNFKAVIDKRHTMDTFENNQEFLTILRIIDLSAKQYFANSIDNMANTLKTESVQIVGINTIMACGICGMLLLFLYSVIKKYERRLILTKKILGLIPLNMLSKSQKIRKYLNATKKSRKI